MNIQVQKSGKSYLVPDDVMNQIRIRMYGYDIHDIAEIAGVSKACIYAIRRGKTLWPRGSTFFGILKALELAFVLVDLRTGRILHHES
jgi:predicted transcriptional regulator